MSSPLPATWARVRLADILAEPLANGRSVRSAASGFPVLRLTALSGGLIDPAQHKIGAWTRQIAEPFIITPGDFLVARGNGSRHLVGRGGVVGPHATDVAFPDTLIRVRVDETVLDLRYLRYVWDSREVRVQIETAARTTAGIYKINQKDLEAIEFPLPPLPEQQCIVEALDAHSTRLDAGISALERVQANVKRYRASVLKAACEGRLVPTEAELARREGRDYEPADVLLGRTLRERRARWEAQELERLKAKGKPLSHDRSKQRYKEPEPPDASRLPELPDGWAWATLDQLAAPEANSITDGPFGSNLKTAHYTEEGPRVVRLQNIGDGEFIDAEAHISEPHFERLEKHWVFPGDIVIASLGSDLPRACLIPQWLGDAIVKADCIRFKPAAGLSPQYLNIALNAEPTKARVTALIHGVGRPRLGLGQIRRIPVPLPPAAEQNRIVAEADRALSLAADASRTAGASLQFAERLRESILKCAFAGRLVPQDPDDEPASVLLERMRAAGRTQTELALAGRPA